MRLEFNALNWEWIVDGLNGNTVFTSFRIGEM